VFTEFGGGILRGVKLLDKGAGADTVPPVPKFRRDGPPLWEEQVHVHPLAAHVYDGCADIFNPIHTSVRFAKSVGLPGIILPGSCTLSWAVRDIVNRHADGDPARLKRIGCRFTGMVLPATDIAIQLLGLEQRADRTTAFFEVRNGDGKRAISDGFVEIAAH
jgi:acyl dehydratase